MILHLPCVLCIFADHIVGQAGFMFAGCVWLVYLTTPTPSVCVCESCCNICTDWNDGHWVEYKKVEVVTPNFIEQLKKK